MEVKKQKLESPGRSIRRRKLIVEDDEEEIPESVEGEEEATPVPAKGIATSSS